MEKERDKETRLLRELQMKCTTSNIVLSERLGVETSTVSRWKDKIEQAGKIKSYKAVLDPEQFGYNTLAFVRVKLLHNNEPRRIQETAEFISKLPGVQEVHISLGEFDLLIKVRTRTEKELKLLILDSLSPDHNVSKTETIVTASTFIETTDIPI